MRNQKKGVSLITVLLFMLVATIAATATFKWLGSANSSSGSQMMLAEARQAANAGIESARSWMTNHGNETGAIIKQYVENGKNPISLDSVLSPLDNGKQNFHVVVTGVDFSETTYKVKIVSSGEARNGTKYSESAILKVNGLYKVQIPTKKSTIDYKYALFGASVTYNGTSHATSLMVNGDWTKNDPSTTGDFVVTGNLTVDGSNILVGGTTCVGGNLSSPNGIALQDLYVAGKISDNNGTIKNGSIKLQRNGTTKDTTVSAVQGDAYIEGAWPQSKGNVTIDGNLTLGGRLEINLQEVAFHVRGNTCIVGNGIITDKSSNRTTQLDGDVFIDHYSGIGPQNYNSDGTKKAFGTSTTSKLYMPGLLCQSENSWMSTGGLSTGEQICAQCLNGNTDNCSYFKTKASYRYNNAPAGNVTCAEDVKKYCQNKWRECTGDECCDGAKYKVDDALTTAYSVFSDTTYTNVCNVTSLANVKALNECYENARPNELYNGFLVVNMTSTERSPDSALKGKFIFIYENQVGKMFFPPTTAGSVAMVMLRQGTDGNGELKQGSCFEEAMVDTTDINGKDTTRCLYNYYLYTEGNIDKMLGGTYDGSVYAKAANCSKIKDINAANFIYNETTMNMLADAAVICPATDENCGGPGGSVSGESGSSTESTVSTREDSDFIATGAQLSIELESQYKTDEVPTNVENVNPSIVVLPRIVYINSDAAGNLSDYYTVMGLNGARVAGTSNAVCTGTGAPSESSITGLEANTYYPCTYTEGDYSSDFYVVVTGESAQTPTVKFQGSGAVEFNSSVENQDYVELAISGVSSTSSSSFTVHISVSNSAMTGWTIDTIYNPNLTRTSTSGGNTIYSYSGTTSNSTQTVRLFKVTANAGAQSGSVLFTLQQPTNCTVRAPSAKSFSITGSTTIVRESLSAYCDKFPDNCSGEYSVVKNYEDCEPDYEWVAAQGDGCGTTETNKTWLCGSGNSESAPITLTEKNFDHTLCDIYIPATDNQIVGAVNDGNNPDGHYTLYASLKKKMYNVHVSLSGAENAKLVVQSKATSDGEYSSVASCDKDEGCDYSFYAGTYVLVSTENNGDAFSYWTCTSGNCGWVNETSTSILLPIDKNYSVEAKFNEKDPHCFYTDFSEVEAFCPNSEATECIDKCKSGNTNCYSGLGEYSGNPDWLMVYANRNANAFEAPQFSDGYVAYNGNAITGNQTVLLSRVLAGVNGTMTARIKTDYVNTNKSTAFINNGFILRSNGNASSYIVMNIYGKESMGTYGRICYGTAQGITNASQCVEKQFRTSTNSSPSINPFEPINVDIHIYGNKIDVALSYQASRSTASVSFDLSSDWALGTFSDVDHRYVGLMLTDKEFRVGDIGWRADDFQNEACFDYPSISCSFAANYLGGMVPLDSNVAPWVGFSSWFGERSDCIANTEYYYNGCDVDAGNFVSRSSALNSACASGEDAKGLYTSTPESGLLLNAPYNFSYEGAHGTTSPDNSGLMRNAFVSVECDERSYHSSCGEFFVGEVRQCSRNETLLNTQLFGSVSEETIEPTSPVNLRASTLIFEITDITDGGYIDVVLEDANGVRSPVRSVSPGSYQLNVDELSILSSFNPEAIAKIILKGSTNYTLKKVTSSCPNAVSITNCSADYEGENWKISKTISHEEGARYCRITPQTTDINTGNYSVQECTNVNFIFNDPDFYSRFNGRTEQTISYDFLIEVFDVENPGTTTPPAAQCVASSGTFEHIKASCRIDNENVVQGAGVPTLHYTIENCPNYGCTYSIALTNVVDKTEEPETAPQAGKSGTWQPDVNGATKLNSGDYTYSVSVFNTNGSVVADCEDDDITFHVEELRDMSGTCSVINNTTLSISITSANHGETQNVPVVTTDLNGNVLSIQTISVPVGEDKSVDINLSSISGLVPGQEYPFALNIGTDSPVNCSGTYKKPVAVTCPDDVSNQKAEDDISVSPTVTGCASGYSWTLSGGSATPTSGTGSPVVFKDENGEGTVSYELGISCGSSYPVSPSTCELDVQFKEDTNIKGTCPTLNGFVPAKITGVNFSMRNLTADNISRAVVIDGNTRGTSSNCNMYYCEPMEITMPSTAGTYTYQLKMGSDVLCTGTLNAQNPLSCSVTSNEVPYGQKFKFTGQRVANGCHNCKLYDGFTTYTDNQGDITNYEITFNSTSSKTYTYECQCDNIDQNAKCTQMVASRVDPPTVTCPNDDSSDPYLAEPRATVPFKPDSLANCEIGCNYTLKSSDNTDKVTPVTNNSYKTNSQVSFTGDNAIGIVKYTFDVSNSAGNGSCDFYVKYSKPEIDCPTYGWSVNAEPGEQVQISANITGCSNCTYKVKRSGISDIPASYSSGKISFPSESSAEDRDYTLEVSNGAPGGTASCPIHIAYYKPEIECPSTSEFTVEPGATFTYPISGKVKYCSSNCAYTVTGGLSPSTASYTGSSITLTSESNGSSTKTYSFNVSNGLTASNSCTIKVNYKSPEITSCPDPNSVEPGGEISFNPVIDNCSSGCSYSIDEVGGSNIIPSSSYTGSNQISFNGANNRTSNSYVFTVANSAGESADCEFDVNYLKPTFSCPANQSVRENSSVSVALSNVTNCTNGCNYSVSGGSTNISGSISGNGNKTLDRSITGEDGGNTTTYTVTLTNGAGSESCTFDVEYSAVTVVADCYFEENNNRMNPAEGYAGRSYTFQIKVTGGITSNVSGNFTFNSSSEGMTLYYNPNSWDNNRWSKSITMPTTPGSYPYSVTYKDRPVCSGNFVVKSKLDCGVNKTEIALGESFTFTASYAGSCWNSSFSGNGSNGHGNCSSSFSVTPSSTGTQTYTYRVGDGSVGSAECSKQVVVVAPQIAIASCAENKTDVATGANVKFTPTVNSCFNNCSWELYEGSTYITGGSGYNGTSQLSFTGSSSTGTKNYTFKVSKDGVEKTCGFSVDYVEPTVSTYTVASGASSFTVSSGTNVCFDAFPAANTWQSQITIVCSACSYSGCSVTFGDVTGDGWTAPQKSLPLSGGTHTGCYMVSRTDNANVSCTINQY